MIFTQGIDGGKGRACNRPPVLPLARGDKDQGNLSGGPSAALPVNIPPRFATLGRAHQTRSIEIEDHLTPEEVADLMAARAIDRKRGM